VGRGPNGAYLFLAQIAEDRKDYDRALDLLSQVEDGNELLEARVRRASILAHQGKLDQARKELSEYAAGSPRERSQLTIAEAALLRDAHQEQAAFDLLNRALAIQPEDPELLYEQGMIAVKLDRLDAMETSMRTLIRIRPAHPHGYNALGYTLADNNIRLDEALALIEKAVSLAPDDPSIIDSLGWVQYRRGNVQLAIENLQRAYAMRADADVAAHLGEALWVGGRHAEAEKVWAEAERKEPTNEALRETLKRLNVNIGALPPSLDA
jgi:tetratricopeptide (TPR) repeat protein